MATLESTSSADGVLETFTRALAPMEVSPETWRSILTATGSDDQARNAPLLQGHGLPGDPGCNKTSYFFKLADGRRINVSRSIYKDGPRVFVHVGLTRAEMAAQDAESEAARVTEKASQTSKEQIKGDINREAARAFTGLTAMVNSEAQYRKKMVKALRGHVRGVRDQDILANRNHGFSMGESVAEELDDLLDQMIDLIAGAKVHFDARKHKRINDDFHSALDKSKPFYREMLAQYRESAQDEGDLE